MAAQQLPWVFLVLAVLMGVACNSGGSSSSAPSAEDPPAPSVTLDRAFPGLSFSQPLAMVQPPGNVNRWYLAEKGGRVLVFPDDQGAAEPRLAIDLTSRVDSGPSEAGLLGIAFHPEFAVNGQVFLSYTAPGDPLVSRISRFTSANGGEVFAPASEEVLLTLDQPYGNHNGGNILFGPDGFLYIGFGDGGAAGDPKKNGQNADNLFGTILRIDVGVAGPDRPYAIPPDNPFANGGGRPEIFAWGLRNPWRFSFDRETRQLWAADVGQDAWEEIDLIEKGGNYGWDLREGAHCFEPPQNCPTEGLIDPVAEYPNQGEDCSITGGYVYRGSGFPELRGTYLFADFCSGRIWGLPLGPDGRPAGAHSLLLDSDLQPSSFAEGQDGEIYLLDFGGGGIWRIAAEGK